MRLQCDRSNKVNCELQEGLKTAQAELGLRRQDDTNKELIHIGAELRSRVEVLSEELRTKCVDSLLTSESR